MSQVTTTPGECAEDAKCATGAPCATERVQQGIMAFVAELPEPAAGARRRSRTEAPGPGEGAVEGAGASSAATKSHRGTLLPTVATPEAAALRAAAAALGCASESCVVAHPRFRAFVERHADLGLTGRLLDRELALRYKPAGPRDSLELTSNHNLDAVLRQWARIFPELYPCPFAMMDFDRNGDAFGSLDLVDVLEGRAAAFLGPEMGRVRRPAPCFACVVNTDVSTGRGKHWVAVFADARGGAGEPWTVEYFNSAGNPPPRAMTGWMERARARLAEHRMGRPGGGGPVEALAVTDVDHQQSLTECGLYALYYVRRRLEGAPPAAFAREPIPDAAMTAFRAHVFRSGR